MQRIRPILPLAVLLIAGCRTAETGSASMDPALAALVPPDTTTLAGFRMDIIRTTALFKELSAQKLLGPLDEFTSEYGLDPRRDIAELLVASNGKDVVAMARGKFNAAKPVQGLVFLDAATVLAGTPAAVDAVLARRKARTGGIPAALREKIKSISIPNQLWMVSLGWNPAIDEAIPQSGNLANLRKIFRTLDSSTLAADVRSGVNLVATGTCRTEQDAKTLGDALRGFVGIGRLMTPDKEPGLLKVYDAIKIEQNGQAIHVEASIPEDLLEKFVKKTAPQVGSR